MTHVEQFEQYVAEQKKKGLQSMNIYWNNPEDLMGNTPPKGATYESFCEEFMRMVNAPDCSDKEVLGKYGKF